MLRKILGIGLWCCLIGLFVFLAFFVNAKRAKLSVSSVYVEIVDSLQNRFVNKADVLSILRKKHTKIESAHLDDLDRHSIEKDIENHPSIEKAEVYTLVDGSLKIRIWQREPVFRYFGAKGYYIDSTGERMLLSKNFTKRVPIVTGNVSLKMAKGDLFEFCKYISETEFWNEYIGQIHVTKDKELVLIPMVGDFKILMGDISNYSSKLNKLKAFLDKAQDNNVWAKYKYINLEYNNQIVCVK
jgi:cell division protein FtsQ